MPTELPWQFSLPIGPAFIIGSSPSLLDEPLHLVEGHRVYLVNKAWKALEMGLIHKANGICYSGLMSWKEHIDEMKAYGLDHIPKFYSDLVTDSPEFNKHASEHDRYYKFPKRNASSNKTKDCKTGYLPKTVKDGIGKVASVTLDMAALCYLIGFKNIYILGMDCDYTAASMYFFEANSWDNYNAAPTVRDGVRKRLACMSKAMAKKGVNLVNLSRGFNIDKKSLLKIPTGRLENVIKGHVIAKTIGLVHGSFNPLKVSDIDMISAARKKCSKLIVSCKNDDTATIMSSMRFVDRTIVKQDPKEGVRYLRHEYPTDIIMLFNKNGKVKKFKVTDADSGKLTLLDCTMRDGGYYNSWNFTEKFAQKYIDSMVKTGVDVIELGFRSFKKNNGPLAYTTDKFLSTLTLPPGSKYSVMVNANDLIMHSGKIHDAVDALFAQDKRKSPIDIVRVAIHLDEIDVASDIIKELSTRGYRPMINLMQISRASDKEITDIAAMLSHNEKMEVFYFADSLGNMNADDVTRTVNAIRKGWHKEIGIHAHNNMEQANANILAAIDAGVTWVDSTIQGMGRGAGNAKTEIMVNELQQHYGKKFESDNLFSITMNDVQRLRKQYGWGPNVLYYYSATNNIHPTFVQHMLGELKLKPDAVMKVLEKLSQGDHHSFSIKHLEKLVH